MTTNVRVLLGPADRLEPGARWVNSIRLRARPNTEPQFCGLEIVNAVLSVGGVAFERRAHTDLHYARTPARARHGPSGGVGCAPNDREPVRLSEPVLGVLVSI